MLITHEDILDIRHTSVGVVYITKGTDDRHSQSSVERQYVATVSSLLFVLPQCNG